MYFQLDKVLFTFILLFTSAVFWYIRRFIWPYRKMPSIFFDRKILIAVLRGKYPIIKYYENHILNVLISMSKIFEKEGLCFAWFLQPCIMVSKEEYVKILLNESAALDKPWHYKVVADTIGDGLATHQGILWKKRRKLMNPAFKFKVLKDYVSTFNCSARLLVDKFSMLTDRSTSDVIHVIKTTFLKTICEILIGKEMKGVENEKKITAYDDLISRLSEYAVYRGLRPWRYFQIFEFLFETGRRHKKDYEECYNFTKYLIEEAMKENTSNTEDLRKDGFKRRSLSHLLLRHHLDDPKSFTMDDLFNEIQTVIVAGHHTTSCTTHWCLIMISIHPEIQQKAFEEVESVLGSGDSDITYEDLNNLKYLDSIIKEALRLYPSVPYFARVLTDDVQCENYKIPKSTVVVFLMHLLHRNPDTYPNPDTFDPERFYNKTLKHPWAFIPFAEGIRTCMGKNFAMLEMKVFLAHILRNFKLSLVDRDKEIWPKWSIVLETASPVRFLLTKR